MSRKIGLCDVHFDPDIEGDIDFDFFSEEVEDKGSNNNNHRLETGRHVTDKTATDLGLTATGSPSSSTTRVSGKPTLNGERDDDDDATSDDGSGSYRGRMAIECEDGTRRDPNRDKDAETWQLRTSEPHNGPSSNVSRCSSSQVRLEGTETPCLVTPNLAINTAIDCMSDHANRLQLEEQLQQQQPMERSLTPKDLLRVTATEMRFGSPLSSDSDSASDLYSLTDEEEEEENDASLDVSDSEITDVSPLSSANMSPLPESPRRRTPEPATRTSSSSSSKFGSFSPRPAGRSLSAAKAAAGRPQWDCNGKSKAVFRDVAAAAAMSHSEGSKETSIDLKLLAKAILELEEERKTNRDDSTKDGSSGGGGSSTMQVSSTRGTRSNSSSLFGQHSESSACSRVSSHSRKNLSFTNDEVRRIEQENKRLLRRIIDSQKPRRTTSSSGTHFFPMHSMNGKLASSAVNRMRELKKIETENLAMLKRLQAAKPTKELSCDFLLKSGGSGAGGRSGSVFGGGGGSTQQYGTCTTPQPSSRCSSHSAGSSHQATTSTAARGRHASAAGRSMSTGSLSSTLASCSISNRHYAGRSRSLKLPNAAAGSVGLGQQTPPAAAAAAGGGR